MEAERLEAGINRYVVEQIRSEADEVAQGSTRFFILKKLESPLGTKLVERSLDYALTAWRSHNQKSKFAADLREMDADQKPLGRE